ncbi:MAG: DUF1801 domain-containing protein [Vicingaceae bacterium]
MDKIEAYIQKKKQWSDELRLLRKWLNEMDVKETLKWGAPVYTVNGKNVIGIGAFKSYVGLWFFQGVLLKDEKGLLINAQENKTKALRQMRFQSMKEMDEKVIKAYIQEAIDNQKAGRELKPEKQKLQIPELLQEELKGNAKLKAQFEKLSLGKQKEYANYIADAKRESTKISRLEKITPMILEGFGLNDQYRNC